MTILGDAIRADLVAHENPERAAAQEAYMKYQMPYHGIASPELKALLRPHLATFAPTSRADWQAEVLDLWDEATHREQRYAAIALLNHRAARKWHDAAALPLLRHLISTGAWWDLVDSIAGDCLARTLNEHRDDIAPVMRAWARDDDLWIRRAAVLSQLGLKGDVDQTLLHDVIEATVDDQSFWLRKAIGWALREQARVDPDWVKAEVAHFGERMSALSRREALKHL